MFNLPRHALIGVLFLAGVCAYLILASGYLNVPSGNIHTETKASLGSLRHESGSTRNTTKFKTMKKDKHNVFQVENISSNLPTLAPDVISGINKLVFFVGNPRTGHSIIGSILDAHPHVVMSHELKFFEQRILFQEDEDKPKWWTAKLFNMIFQHTIKDTQLGGLRNVDSVNKGYTLAINSLWQGKFDEYIQVIGDKSAGSISMEYIRDRVAFRAHYQKLVNNVGIPIKALYVIRNPFDIISTCLLYTIGRREKKYLNRADFIAGLNKQVDNSEGREEAKYYNYPILERRAKRYFEMTMAVAKLIDLIGQENVLNVHLRDLVHKPKDTILYITDFLGIGVEDDYLQLCADKVYDTVSHSRNLVAWPPELRVMVENRMKEFEILQGYNFTSD